MDRIGDYALIGDCHSAALVGISGSIDWASFPRFDSPSVFARILDEFRGGSFSVAPVGPADVERSYLPDTNVLETRFETPQGTLELTDCMPIAGDVRHAILRRARCTQGTVEVDVVVAPRFEYGAFCPRFMTTGPTTAEIFGGADALHVQATRPIERTAADIRARWTLHAGDEAWLDTRWLPSHVAAPPPTDPAALAARCERLLDATVEYWRTWLAQCWYDGEHRDAVHRSALVLKAMTYAPTGAVVAAPTTSLPEEIGGTRNWDYRFTWIRDATLTLTSLVVLGFMDEANAFKRYLERAAAGHPKDLQIMYGIGGERTLTERQITHLAGHRGSAPVRVGNGAAVQIQLDAYGGIMQAAMLYAKAGGSLTEDNARYLAGLADLVCDRWDAPDHGIWEMRDDPRHFTHSKLNCWIALDRAVKLAGPLHAEVKAKRWARERDEIRRYLIDKAAPEGWFHQATGFGVPDASTLLVPASGFVATGDPLSVRTIEVVRQTLERDGLVYRYLSSDGIEGGEGTFLLCSFWLVDCLTFLGKIDEADALLTRLLGFANDVGLLSEEVDPRTGEPLGNTPQAFSHMALVLSCAHLSAAKRGEIPAGATDYAELAVDRLLQRRPARAPD